MFVSKGVVSKLTVVLWKRATLEALLVLETEEMEELKKAILDLQEKLVELATDKETLVGYLGFTHHSLSEA